MSVLRRLRVQNIRNHTDGTFDFSPDTTLIVGNNGAGKTSLLEAIYIAYHGSSFKGTDADIIRNSSEWYRIDTSDDSFDRTIRYTQDSSGRMKKSFEVDTKKTYRLAAKYRRPVVIFSPDDLQLLSGSPARRRKYLNTLIAQLDPKYGPALRRYEQALMQRNRLLKSLHCSSDLIFPWNVILSEYGAYLLSARIRLVDIIDGRMSEKYRTLAGGDDSFKVRYSHSKHTAQYLLAEYEASYDKDRMLGSTSVGIHRHDVIIEMNGRTAQDIASRGENRTIILALKSIEAEILTELYDDRPLILLDDVYGELDDARQKLVDRIFKGYQTIITSTHEVKNRRNHTISL